MLGLRSAFALAATLSLASGAFYAGAAHAQDSDNRDAARAAFERGAQAADSGRWADALREFEEAYLLSGVPTALFNAGMALRALGRHVEARDTFDRLIESHPDSPASEQARPFREEVAARVAVLELVGLDRGADVELRLDGRRLEVTITDPTELELDPGRHGLVAEREGYETFTWEGRLADGERERVEVVLVERPASAPVSGPAEEEERSIARSPLLWIAVGVVLIAGGVGLGIGLTRDPDLEPGYGNVFTL
jgi:tetratricopeptide (TPR) repeat protein